jgi:subtilisin family serine protease
VKLNNIPDELTLTLTQDATIESYTTSTQDNAPWFLDRIDSRTGIDGQYTYEGDGTGVHVYVLDAIIIDQEEFGGRLVQPCVDFTGFGCSSVDAAAHGTHVAGT